MTCRMRCSWLSLALLVMVAGCTFDDGGLPGSDPTSEDPIVPLRDTPDAGMIIDPPLLEPDAAPPTPPGPPDAAVYSDYGDSCSNDDQCASMMCVDFKGPKGKRCTQPCEWDGDCPSDDRCVEREGDRICDPAI